MSGPRVFAKDTRAGATTRLSTRTVKRLVKSAVSFKVNFYLRNKIILNMLRKYPGPPFSYY